MRNGMAATVRRSPVCYVARDRRRRCRGDRHGHGCYSDIIISIDNGDVIADITDAGGNDEVWFDPASQHYYLAARGTLTDGKVTPILGTVDAGTFMFDDGAPTSTTAHSVAADKFSHHVFVPIGFVPTGSPAGTDPTNPCPATAASRSTCRHRSMTTTSVRGWQPVRLTPSRRIRWRPMGKVQTLGLDLAFVSLH